MNPLPVSTELFILLAAMQAADVYSTIKILGAGGVEQNPLMAKLFAVIGILPGLLLVKGVMLAALWLFVLPYPWMIGALCLWYAGVLVHNWKSL